MAATSSNYLSISSGHVDNLIEYVRDVKPYHTKLTGIIEEYVFNDDVSVVVTDTVSVRASIFVGYDVEKYAFTLYDSGAILDINLSTIDYPFYLGNFIGLKITGATTDYPELGAIADWVPLSFTYFLEDGTTASDPVPSKIIRATANNLPAFEIVKAFTNDNQTDKANLTFDPTFLSTYLSGSHTVRQFFNEILWQEIFVVGASPMLMSLFSAPLPNGGTSDAIDAVGTSFSDAFTIAERVNGSVDRYNLSYDVVRDAVGKVITIEASTYVVNHNGPASSPTIILESVNSPGTFVSPSPNMMPSLVHPSAVNRKAFSFQLPSGFSPPFKLMIS